MTETQKDSTLLQKLSGILFLILWMGPPLILGIIANFFVMVKNSAISMYNKIKSVILPTAS